MRGARGPWPSLPKWGGDKKWNYLLPTSFTVTNWEDGRPPHWKLETIVNKLTLSWRPRSSSSKHLQIRVFPLKQWRTKRYEVRHVLSRDERKLTRRLQPAQYIAFINTLVAMFIYNWSVSGVPPSPPENRSRLVEGLISRWLLLSSDMSIPPSPSAEQTLRRVYGRLNLMAGCPSSKTLPYSTNKR